MVSPMPRSSILSSIRWTSRLNRVHRMMKIEIDGGELGRSTAVTSNLSRGGLAAIGDSALKPGDRAMIRFGGIDRIPATVVWHQGRRLGFQFERELNLFEYFGARLQVRKWH